MKKLAAGLILITFTAFSPGPAVSQGQWSGMNLVQYCTGDTVVFDPSVCRAYIQGVADANDFFRTEPPHPKSFCRPRDKTERNKGEALVPKWIEAFPEKSHQKPIVLVVDALNDIFPCPDKKGRK